MIPQATFDPYIMQQAACRASLLVTSAGLPREDWEDLRQNMVLDCLLRTPRFDAARGDWKAFVRGVIRNHAATIAQRESQRVQVEALTQDNGESDDIEEQPLDDCWGNEPAAVDPSRALNLRIDVDRVLARLPENLRSLALQLPEMSVAEIAAESGRSRTWIYILLNRLREAFIGAGVTPDSLQRKRGLR